MYMLKVKRSLQFMRRGNIMKKLLFLLIILFNTSILCSSMYVLSNKANVMSEPSMANRFLIQFPW